MTFPSLACLPCKQRHLKCIGTLPICDRCLKSHINCFGMKKHDDALASLHSENPFASGRRKRPRGPRSSTSIDIRRRRNVREDESVRTSAIDFYLRSHLSSDYQVPSLARGVDDDILPYYLAHQTNSSVQLALGIIALGIYGRVHKHRGALIEAALDYQELLRLSQEHLFSFAGDIEASLFINFCMSRYEDAVSSSSGRKTFESSSHHDGSLALLKHYRNLNHISLEVPSIVKHTRRSMIKSALLRDRELPEWIQVGEEYGEKGLELEYDRLILRLAAVRHQLHNLQLNSTIKESTLQEVALDALRVVDETGSIDSALEAWFIPLSDKWPRNQHNTKSFPTENRSFHFSQGVYTYTNKSHASIWLRWQATHLLCVSTQITARRHTSWHAASILSPSAIMLESKLLAVAKDFAASLPYCFGVSESGKTTSEFHNIDPGVVRYIAWPLSLALCAEELPAEARDRFSTVIAHVGKASGIGVLETGLVDIECNGLRNVPGSSGHQQS